MLYTQQEHGFLVRVMCGILRYSSPVRVSNREDVYGHSRFTAVLSPYLSVLR
ncbi:hypothetical protein HMPREF1091_00514 [Atopobium minutum 10063974]|uniref:Uncharacterized protein n=2 Tax=Atopobium minutum TaxID=1381 RepID=N2BST9_9ACTN|nr:hypothetical protein HMPREF1091_00514 [Atopobium minutum 10063974]SEB56301.1 hypothetical protein SAMN04489746_0611 [Atopobium minutum]